MKARLNSNFLKVTVGGKTFLAWFPNWLTIDDKTREKLNKNNQSLAIVEDESGESKVFLIPNNELSDIWLNNKKNKYCRDVLKNCILNF